MTHLNGHSENLDGKASNWMEKVSDEQYKRNNCPYCRSRSVIAEKGEKNAET
jgi:DNA-directed RNA polymerase subunit RPC12/RpoP